MAVIICISVRETELRIVSPGPSSKFFKDLTVSPGESHVPLQDSTGFVVKQELSPLPAILVP